MNSKLLKKIFVHIFWFLPDKMYLSLAFYMKLGKKLNWSQPKTFNEKINWLKMNDNNPLINTITDKYKVREYVSKKIGSEVLVPLLWIGENATEIPFDTLPNSFVLKSNEGSGKNYIVTNKNEINCDQVVKRANHWLKSKFSYMFGRERCYQKTKRLLLIEKYIGTKNDLPADYKFFMTNGEFIMLEYCFDRQINNQREVRIEYLDSGLNPCLESSSESSFFIKPDNFDEMLRYSKLLSEEFQFVRVDFYSINNKVYFGELTLYPSSGWKKFPKIDMDEILGEKISMNI